MAFQRKAVSFRDSDLVSAAEAMIDTCKFNDIARAERRAKRFMDIEG
jgi:hypothetical protein